MPLTISRVVGIIETDQGSFELFSDIPTRLEPQSEDGRQLFAPSKRTTLGGAVPTIRLDANIKRLLAQLEDELQIVRRCLDHSAHAARN